MEKNKTCIYDVCHKGQCGEPTIDGQSFCLEHIQKSCGITTREEETGPWKTIITEEDLKAILESHFRNLISPKQIEKLQTVKYQDGHFAIHIFGTETKYKAVRCGEPAIGDCHSYAGSYVCGMPLCQEHKKTHKH
jgi:hypothetical protein